jgi:dUTP pyrophosphatase
MEPFIKFKLMREGAQLPKRGTDGSGGFDFYAPEDGFLDPGEKRLIPSGVAHEMPGELSLRVGVVVNDKNYHQFPEPNTMESEYLYPVNIPIKIQGILFDRSGLGGKKGIRLSFACLIDNDYRGEIWLSLENHSQDPFCWHAGDRLCQVCYVPMYAGGTSEVVTLSDTHRGEGGFGSTGR